MNEAAAVAELLVRAGAWDRWAWSNSGEGLLFADVNDHVKWIAVDDLLSAFKAFGDTMVHGDRFQFEGELVGILCDRWDDPECYGPEGRAKVIADRVDARFPTGWSR